MRQFITIIESGFDRQREADYGDKIGSIRAEAQRLRAEIAQLEVAPSVQTNLNDAMSTVVDYLDGLMGHINHNLSPRRR